MPDPYHRDRGAPPPDWRKEIRRDGPRVILPGADASRLCLAPSGSRCLYLLTEESEFQAGIVLDAERVG